MLSRKSTELNDISSESNSDDSTTSFLSLRHSFALSTATGTLLSDHRNDKKQRRTATNNSNYNATYSSSGSSSTALLSLAYNKTHSTSSRHSNSTSNSNSDSDSAYHSAYYNDNSAYVFACGSARGRVYVIDAFRYVYAT